MLKIYLVRDLKIVLIFDECLSQNYLKWFADFYKMLDELSIGFSLSPILAEICMNNF